MKYPVVLHTDDGVAYGVTVPDIAGCFSAGNSIDEALTSVLEAIDLHLEGITEDGGDVPAASSITKHQQNPDFAGGIWAIVAFDTSRFDGKCEKLNITLPKKLLAKIDAHTKKNGLTRSGFLAKAAMSEIAAA